MKIEEEINWGLKGFSLARIAHARDVLLIDGVRHAACGRQKLIVFFYKERFIFLIIICIPSFLAFSAIYSLIICLLPIPTNALK